MKTLDVRRERRQYQESLGQDSEESASLQDRLQALPSGPSGAPPEIPRDHAQHWNRAYVRERARLVKLWLLYDDAEAEVRELEAELSQAREHARGLRGQAAGAEEEIVRLAEAHRSAEEAVARLRSRIDEQMAELDQERERSRELHGRAVGHEEEASRLLLALRDVEKANADLESRLEAQVDRLEESDERIREVMASLVTHEEEVLRLTDRLRRSEHETHQLRSRESDLHQEVVRLRHQVAAREDEARYARSVLQAAREEGAAERAEGQLGVGPLFDRWDRISDNPAPYREGPYTLYAVDVVVAGGGSRTFYFFARNEPERGKPVPMPPGYAVDHNPKNGLPYLRKTT